MQCKARATVLAEYAKFATGFQAPNPASATPPSVTWITLRPMGTGKLIFPGSGTGPFTVVPMNRGHSDFQQGPLGRYQSRWARQVGAGLLFYFSSSNAGWSGWGIVDKFEWRNWGWELWTHFFILLGLFALICWEIHFIIGLRRFIREMNDDFGGKMTDFNKKQKDGEGE
jgi:hypothetical protein